MINEKNQPWVLGLLNWDGKKFTGAGIVKVPPAMVNEQSFGVTPDEKYLWMAGFSKDSQWELLCRLTLKW